MEPPAAAGAVPKQEPLTDEQLAEMDLSRYLNCTECDEWHKTTRNQGVFVPPHPMFPATIAAEIPIDERWRDLSPIDYGSIRTHTTDGKVAAKRIKLYEELKLEIASLDNLRMDPESGIDGFWIRLFLVKGHDYCWFHYSIRMEAWDKFYEVACANTKR